MNIKEFQPYEEPRSDYDRLISDFRKTGVRCMVKHYTDHNEIAQDIEKLRYRINATGKNSWLIVSKRGLDLLLINTEVEQ